MIENAPVLVQELDRRNAAITPGDVNTEMAFWEQACQLGVWYVVNRGTQEQPLPSGYEIPEIGKVLGVYSTPARAGQAAGEGGTFVGVPMPGALDWLASYGSQGVAGVVMDHPGPWIPLPNLSYLKRWVPAEGYAAVTAQVHVAAPGAQAAMDAYVDRPSDEGYEDVVRELAAENLLVILDPSGDGSLSHIVNQRDERVLLGFTDTARVDALLSGKAADIQERPGAEVLGLVGSSYDVLIVDPQHPASFAATPDWIRDTLGGGAPAAPAAPEKKRSRWFGRG